MDDDGNCLFRALSYQLYGTQDVQNLIRERLCDYMQVEQQYFQEFVTGEDGSRLSNYIANMRNDRTWGGNLELQAFSELYQCTVEIYKDGPEPEAHNVFGRGYSTGRNEQPVRLHFRICV